MSDDISAEQVESACTAYARAARLVWPPKSDSAARERRIGMRAALATALPPRSVILTEEAQLPVKALQRIVRLQQRWEAPVVSDDWEASNQAWAAVGSEAHKIAVDTLAKLSRQEAPGE